MEVKDITTVLYLKKDVPRKLKQILHFIKFSVNIHNFEIQSMNVTINSLICNNYKSHIIYIKTCFARM